MTHSLIESTIQRFSNPVGWNIEGFVVGKPMIKRLLKALGATERRKFVRFRAEGEQLLVIGLDALIRHLNHEAVPERAPDKGAAIAFKGVTWLSMPNFAIEAIARDKVATVDSKRHGERAVALSLADHARTRVRREEIWSDQGDGGAATVIEPSGLLAGMLNVSSHGHGLLWLGTQESCLRVGELVGLPAAGEVLHIAVVRWLNHDAQERLMLGVELIAPLAIPVKLATAGRNEVEPRKSALFYPADQRLGKHAGLLVRPSLFHQGQLLWLESPEGKTIYHLEKELESTPSYQHFSLVGYDGLAVPQL
jgi:hypothetical protein